MSIAQLNPSVQSKPSGLDPSPSKLALDYLTPRGVSKDTAELHGLKYLSGKQSAVALQSQYRNCPSIRIPFNDPITGSHNGYYCYRFLGDNLPMGKDKKGNYTKPIRFANPTGGENRLYFTHRDDYETALQDITIPVTGIEGPVKSLSLWQTFKALGINTITTAIAGCHNYNVSKKVKNRLCHGHESINPKGRNYIYIADSNVVIKKDVFTGVKRYCDKLTAAGFIVSIVVTPQGWSGMDDFIADPNHDGPAKFLELYNNPVAYAEWVISLEDQFKSTGKGKDGEDGPSTFEILTEIINSDNKKYWISVDDDSQYFVDLTIDGRTETLDLSDKKSIIVDHIIRSFVDAVGGGYSPNRGAVVDCIADKRDRIRHTAPKYKVGNRIQMDVDPQGNIAIYYDLGDPDWNIVKITKDGRVVIPYSECPVKFKRSAPTKAVQVSTVAATLDEVREAFGLDDHSLILLVASMMSVFIPDMPKPILNVVGPKGSGKTTMMERVIEILDPVKVAPLLSELPETMKALMIAGQGRQVLTYDNLSKLTEKQSNTLSTVATGAGFVDRKLYSDTEEVALSLNRLQAITSVDDTISRSDLASRAFRFDFNTTINSVRKSKAQLDKISKDHNPRIRAWLFDGLVAAIRNDYQNIDVSQVETRFLDLAQLMAGAEVALGFPAGAFAEAVAVNNGIIQQAVDDANPVLSAFLSAMEDRPRRRETASGWIGILQKKSDDPTVESLKAAGLGKMLSGSLGADLRDRGFRVEFIKRTDNNYWDIRKSPELLPPQPPQPPYPSQGKDSSDGSSMEDGSKMEADTANLGDAVATNEPPTQPTEPMEATTNHPPSSIHPPSSKPLPSKGYGSYGSCGSKSQKVNPQEIDQIPLPLGNPFEVGDPVEDPTIGIIGEVIDILGDMVLVQWDPTDSKSTSYYHFLEIPTPED